MISRDLINRCICKEQQAMQLCYEACAPYIYSIVKTYIYDKQLHKDIMQDIFVALFTSLENFNSEKGQFKSWMSSLAINQCIGVLRKKKKEIKIVPIQKQYDTISDDQVTTLERLDKKDLEKLLHRMPKGYKTVFLLSVIDGYSHKEIGNVLEITAETSRSQLSRSIAWIKKNLIVESKKYIYG